LEESSITSIEFNSVSSQNKTQSVSHLVIDRTLAELLTEELREYRWSHRGWAKRHWHRNRTVHLHLYDQPCLPSCTKVDDQRDLPLPHRWYPWNPSKVHNLSHCPTS